MKVCQQTFMLVMCHVILLTHLIWFNFLCLLTPAQLHDLMQLKQENVYLTTIARQISPYILSIAKVKERLEPRCCSFLLNLNIGCLLVLILILKFFYKYIA